LRIVRESAGATSVTLYDFEPTPDRICDDVARGLTSSPKKLQPKYFYDEAGARLFERITELEVYYPTRTELSILHRFGAEIADRIGPRVRLVEFGSGSGEKTWILLNHLHDPAAYIPVDISRSQLVEFALSVAEAFPDLDVVPVCADYTHEFTLPSYDHKTDRCVAFFPGSTIGNFEAAEAGEFLRGVRRLVGPAGGLLLGVDLLKDREIIERAYNDPEGITAAFNLNLLVRINAECGADFDVAAFRHAAVFDERRQRIEMRLISEREQVVHLCPEPAEPDRTAVHFGSGEIVTTEYSHKYDLIEFAAFVERTGWSVSQIWTDPREWFAVVLLA
jgi:dimethylhistidine N-methyltransferase